MKVTQHAATRIMRGDTTGLRTKLSIEEVTTLAKAPFAIHPSDGNTYVWSAVDQCCLTLICARRRSTIVTVHATDRDFAPWMGLLSHHRYDGGGLRTDVPTTTRTPETAVQLSLVTWEAGVDAKGAKEVYAPFCVWYDFGKCDSPMFTAVDFHQTIATHIRHFIDLVEPSRRCRKHLYVHVHGNYWAFLFPAALSFEVLHSQNPLS